MAIPAQGSLWRRRVVRLTPSMDHARIAIDFEQIAPVKEAAR